MDEYIEQIDEREDGRFGGGDVQESQPSRSSLTNSMHGSPPITNRGVATLTDHLTLPGFENFRPIGRDIDALTMTTGTELSKYLVDTSRLYLTHGRIQGFEQSEQRIWHDGPGEYWRRYEPVTPSARWDDAYESWMTTGDTSPCLLAWMQSGPHHDSRASRIDVAWDYVVPEYYAPRDFFQDFPAKQEPRIAGTASRGTYYANSRDSDRCLRVYRRDWKEDTGEVRPVLRVELELKGGRAHQLWPVLLEDKQKFYAMASELVFGTCPFIPQGENCDVPPLPAKAPDMLKTCTYYIKQWAPLAKELASRGVDVDGLMDISASRKVDRATKHRRSKKLEQVSRYGVAEFVELLAMKIVE